MRKIFFVTVLFLISISWIDLLAQVAWLKPANPGIDDSLTLYFNAAEGNVSLKGYTGDIYLHTGVITSKSLDGHDWKYVVGNWGTVDKRVLMKRESTDLYSFKMVIRSFYNMRAEDKAKQLSFVFRNADGSLVGKTKENEDILVPVDGYVAPKAVATGLNRQTRKLLQVSSLSDGWKLSTDHGFVWVKPWDVRMVQVSFALTDKEVTDSSHAVIMKPGRFELKTEKLVSGYLLMAGDFRIYARSNPFSLHYIFRGDTILAEESGFFAMPGNTGVRFKMKPAEQIFGLGERAIPLDRRGYRLPLYNRPSYGYEMGATMLNYSVPMSLSSEKYAVLYDNPQKGYVDVGKDDKDVMEWGFMGGPARYYVMASASYAELMQRYTHLTGRQELPPRWALGNLMSRMAYRNQVETDSIVGLMQEKGFPVDAVILDFYWFGDSILGHLGRLDWYKRAWPDPEGMIKKFRKTGVKTVLITEPYVIDSVPNFKDGVDKGIFATDSLGKTYVNHQFYFGPGALIDIFKPSAREWFWEKYRKQIGLGVAGWWGDLGEPESHPSDIYHVAGKADEVHNIFGHYWDRMLYEKYAQYYPNTRLFHLQRSGFAGSQRYSAYPWTGDVSRSWGGLQAQLPLLLSMGMNGLGYIHSDAGGFAQGVKDEELYTRWLQFAAYTPIFRPHGSGIPSEPVYFSEQTQRIVKQAIELRYSMIPYNYTLAWENATSGEPLMRPLYYYHDDSISRSISDQYYWGKNLLVAPVLEKGAMTRKLWLPDGDWISLRTKMKIAGGRWIEDSVFLEEIPVFIKSGSFIPVTSILTTTEKYKGDYYYVAYFPSGISTFTQYEDDGKNRQAIQDGQYELITYRGSVEADTTRIQLSKTGSWPGMPKKRTMNLRVYRSAPWSLIAVLNTSPGKPLSAKRADIENSPNFVGIKFLWDGKPVTIMIIDK